MIGLLIASSSSSCCCAQIDHHTPSPEDLAAEEVEAPPSSRDPNSDPNSDTNGTAALAAPAARALLCHAEADPFVPKAQLEGALAQLSAIGSPWELALYGPATGAKHGFTNPAQALNDNPAFGYDATVARHAWEAARLLLVESLGA